MSAIKQKIKNYLLLFLPITYIGYLIYVRVFLTRAPRDLVVFPHLLTALIVTAIILAFLVRIYFLLKSLGIIKTKETKNAYLRLLKIDIQRLQLKLLFMIENVFRFFADNLKSYNEILRKIAFHLYMIMPSKIDTIVVLFMDVGSKIIVVSVFFVDVFYFKQLNYFYKTLWLLLLPICVELFKIALMRYHKDNITNLIARLDSIPIEGTEYHELCFKENVELFELTYNFEEYYYFYFMPVFQIPYTLGYRLDTHEKYHVKAINLCICVIYLIGWSYVWLIGMAVLY